MRVEGLREPGRVLLVSCYELGHQPMGLASPLAFLVAAGYRPSALDLAVEPFDENRVRRALFVGISVPMHTALRLGVPAARRIRTLNPGCHICFYGLYASMNAEYLLGHGADTVIAGELEEPLVKLLGAVEGGDSPLVPSRPALARQNFPVPHRSELPPLDRYARLQKDDADLLDGYVEATRGCKHFCLHCPIPPVYGGRFFAVPREIVLDDIRQLVASGARHITFGDPDFLNAPTHSLKIARALHAEMPQITFDFTAKVEHIVEHADMMSELGALGCLFAVSAVESLNDRVLANLDKGHTRADVVRALEIARAAKIALRPSFVPFTPWETLESYLELLDFVESGFLIDHVDPIQLTIRLLIPPGSALLESPAMKPHLGDLIPDLFTYAWAHPDSRMDALQKEVAVIVERAVQRGEDPAVAFHRIRALARAVHDGCAPEEVAPISLAHRHTAPRLTEPWFC